MRIAIAINRWCGRILGRSCERSTQECRDLGPRPARRAGAQPAGKCAAPDDTLCHRAAALSAESFSAPRPLHPEGCDAFQPVGRRAVRSEEHTSELQSLLRISYAVFCLKQQKQNTNTYQK